MDVRFQVDYRFPVVFARDVFAPGAAPLADLLATPPGGDPVRVLCYLDAGVLAARPGLPDRIRAWFTAASARGLHLAAPPAVLHGGEAAKDGFALLARVAEDCTRAGLCRHSWVAMAGGGAFLDAVGFAASLVHRGLRQIRLPTTTLAQADAGLGVKNAVNWLGQKNLLGTFTPPQAVLCDLTFLDTLDDRAWRAAVAEAVKVAAIRDACFARELATLAPRLAARDAAAMERCVRRCAELHLAHIAGAGDPFERGSSRPLDFGHWSAHRLEILTGHRLGHGDAVAIGVALDLCYAVEDGRLATQDADLLIGCLRIAGFPLWDEALEQRQADGALAVWAGLAQFREHLGGRLTLAMPDGLGCSRDLDGLDPDRFDRALARLRAFSSRP